VISQKPVIVASPRLITAPSLPPSPEYLTDSTSASQAQVYGKIRGVLN
jgi:hypothetical protein